MSTCRIYCYQFIYFTLQEKAHCSCMGGGGWCVIYYRCTPAVSSPAVSVLEMTRNCCLLWPTLFAPSGPTTVFERPRPEVTSLSWTTPHCSEYDLRSRITMKMSGAIVLFRVHLWPRTAPIWVGESCRICIEGDVIVAKFKKPLFADKLRQLGWIKVSRNHMMKAITAAPITCQLLCCYIYYLFYLRCLGGEIQRLQHNSVIIWKNN